MTATATAYRQNTPEWEAERLNGIGGSDIPVIAGESPYKSALELWAEKTRRITPEHDAATLELFELGHLMEPVLLTLYERRTGRKPKRVARMLQHPEHQWARASLDGTAPVCRAVEAKWSTSSRWGDEGIPDDVLLQVQWGLFVTGWQVADVVALAGRSVRIVEVERDQPLIDDLHGMAAEFWAHVQDGTPPKADGSESARRTLGRLHPRDDGTYLPADAELAALVAELRQAKADAKAAEAREATVSNALRAVLADASGIEGLLTYRRNADSQRVNWPAVGAAYRDLLAASLSAAELDAVIQDNTTTSEGPRVLRLSKEKAS